MTGSFLRAIAKLCHRHNHSYLVHEQIRHIARKTAWGDISRTK